MEIISSQRLDAGSPAASETAIVCIHWQNEMIDPGQAFGSMFAPEIERRGLLPKMADLLDFARARGIAVVFANVVFAPHEEDADSRNRVRKLAAERGSLLRGSVSAAIIGELGPRAGDMVVEHFRGGVFEDSELDELLRARGIKAVALAGLATNVAVDQTVREAMTRGYRTILLEDCCCSFSQEYHDAALMTLRLLASDVMSSGDFQSLADARPARRGQEEG